MAVTSNLKLLLILLLFLASFLYVQPEEETGDSSVEYTDKADDTEDDDGSVRIEDSVLVLGTENFDEVVSSNPTILVEFYAPWCGHCKSLAPQYSAAAEQLAKNDPPVPLAKVDATVHSQLAQRFDVSGYPTLKFFKNGKDYEYDGPRNTEGIVEYMKKRADPKWEPEPDAVITLTSDDFDETVNNEDLMLVEFYAPWCGHCKKLAPIYEKAAKELQREEPPILLAKVDATEASDLASKYGVSGYPTLKVFRKGKAFDYRGERNSPYDFVSYLKNQVGDGAKEINHIKVLKEFFVPDEISVVGFFESRGSSKVIPYRDLSNDIRDDYSFGIVFESELAKSYKLKPNSIVVFTAERFHTKYEPKWHVLEVKDDTTADNIHDFIKQHQFPLVGHYTRPRADRYNKKRPLCLVFYSVDFSFDHRDATQFWRRKIADIAKKFPEITFAVADDEENTELLQQFGLDESGEELNLGLFGADGKKYAMEPMDEFDSDDVVEFLAKYKKGKLKPYIKSQRPPKKQTGPVTVVVADTFDQIVKDSSKDVLLELYAPWCGHCKSLEPKYEALAKKLKDDKNLVIAKMDATANDLPDNYSTSGYPTLYFAASNKKDSPLNYEGPREIGDLEKFLKDHATVSFGRKKKEEL